MITEKSWGEISPLQRYHACGDHRPTLRRITIIYHSKPLRNPGEASLFVCFFTAFTSTYLTAPSKYR